MTIYRNPILLTFSTAMLLSAPRLARADFVLKSTAADPAAAQSATMAPIGDPEDLAASVPRKPSWHWKVARGFGRDVPLGFACRQIIPATVHVTYGPGAKPSMVVSWKGGKAWNVVLREAVGPIGLRLVMTHMAVEIRK